MSGFMGTPGPWIAVDKRPHSDGFSIFSGNQYVAFVGDSDGVTDYLSNANLIAAAPELLEALQRLVKAVNYGTGDELLAAEELAEAAMEKALGNH